MDGVYDVISGTKDEEEITAALAELPSLLLFVAHVVHVFVV